MAESPQDQQLTKAVRKSAARGSQIIAAQARADGGKIGGWFGNKHQLPNILAVISMSLIIMIFVSIGGAIYWKDLEFFKIIGLPLLAALTTILGYFVGRNTVSSRDP